MPFKNRTRDLLLGDQAGADVRGKLRNRTVLPPPHIEIPLSCVFRGEWNKIIQAGKGGIACRGGNHRLVAISNGSWFQQAVSCDPVRHMAVFSPHVRFDTR
jgi:hypothetical protein